MRLLLEFSNEKYTKHFKTNELRSAGYILLENNMFKNISTGEIFPLNEAFEKRISCKYKFISAFPHFVNGLREDKSLYRAYKSNIAMAFVDTFCQHHNNDLDKLGDLKIHKIANEAASYFLNLLTQK